MKQVTGREHHNIEGYIIPVIADAIPKDFLIAIRLLMDFCYLGQALEIDDNLCLLIESALKEFHDHKQSILDAKARRRQESLVILNWQIPKLEFMQSVVPNICLNGVAIQWSADRTENAHISEVKVPARASNNQNYEAQICRHLDHSEKHCIFDLAMAMRNADVNFSARFACAADGDDNDNDNTGRDDEDDEDALITTTSALLDAVDPVSQLFGVNRKFINYFAWADLLRNSSAKESTPLRIFLVPQAAFQLARDAHFKKMAVNDVSRLFNLPDLQPALYDYVAKVKADASSQGIFSIGGRRLGNQQSRLPFTHLEVWSKIRLQTKSYHYPHCPNVALTINSAPPSKFWPLGQHEAVIANIDLLKTWPGSGLSGENSKNLLEKWDHLQYTQLT